MLSKVCVCAQLYPTLCNTIDYSLPGSSVYGIFQARIPKRVAISYASGSSRRRDQPASLVSSALMGRFLTTAPPGKPTVRGRYCFTPSLQNGKVRREAVRNLPKVTSPEVTGPRDKRRDCGCEPVSGFLSPGLDESRLKRDG